MPRIEPCVLACRRARVALEWILHTAAVVDIISRDDLRAKIDRGDPFVLVETLSSEHFEHAHLPGATNLPPDRVTEFAPRVLPDKRAEVVLYCANINCHAAEHATHELRALGYENVRYYPGGKHEWITAGLPMERGALQSR